ncbi:MAG: SDR family oxidoreductase [Actinomycetia bacterium]|nr:SDR family oxidoreductase [Actinomycetes bacterium]
MTNGATGRRRVAVVTGGGRGIGAAIAEELGQRGSHVVTIDPLVALDGGTDPDAAAQPSTAERIVAAGGSASASSGSVTDIDHLRDLFAGLVEEFGGVDAVVNVAGITRPTGFASGSESDWREVLEVHLGGYCNVLRAALPHMAAAGHGRILGVTSGAGWRPADAGAYSCAKRAVAALTWQLGQMAPDGVTVNALSPIAMTRMVEAAMARRRPAGEEGRSRSGGLRLGSGLPDPTELAPLAAHMMSEGFGWCSGQVVFAGGSELALIEAPRLLEALSAEDDGSAGLLLDAVGVTALAGAHDHQQSSGGAGQRFAGVFDATDTASAQTGGRCGIVSDDESATRALVAALSERGTRTSLIDPGGTGDGFEAAANSLAASERGEEPLDALVVCRRGHAPTRPANTWQSVLDDHDGITGRILGDAAFTRAVADHARRTGRKMRLVTMIDTTSSGGRSRIQAATQLARSAGPATDGLVTASTVGLATPDNRAVASHLAAYLATHAEAAALSGAELLAGDDWIGLHSHPRVGTSIVYRGPDLPDWLDSTLRSAVTGGGA